MPHCAQSRGIVSEDRRYSELQGYSELQKELLAREARKNKNAGRLRRLPILIMEGIHDCQELGSEMLQSGKVADAVWLKT